MPLKLSLTFSEQALNQILALPVVVAAAQRAGVTRLGTVTLSDTGISFKLTAKGQRAKVKVGLVANGSGLVVNIRDVRVSGVSVGGGWFEGLVVGAATGLPVRVEKKDGAMHVSVPRMGFRAAGVQDGKLHVILDLIGD